MNWYTEVLKKYAVFEGRASRSEYWYFNLFNSLINLILYVFLLLGGEIPLVAQVIALIAVVYTLGVLLPSIAVTVRRLHDTGKSGWWFLIALIPIIGTIVLLVFMVIDSQEGSNAYGENPKTHSKSTNDFKKNDVFNGSPETTREQAPPTVQKPNYGYKLVPENGQYPIVHLAFGDKKTLGRNGDVVIQNAYVSGKHLLLWTRDIQSLITGPNPISLFVQDLGSTNGTYINGRKLNPNEQVPISESDRIILGSEDVVYRLQKS